jgi:phosphatidylinositol transfer protein SFH5
MLLLPDIRAATKKVVFTLQQYYPETLSRKFFVNVPLIMGWAFQAMKLLAAKETARKFMALSYAEYLAGELGPGVPKEYGGEAESLDVIGETMKLGDEAAGEVEEDTETKAKADA